MICSRCKENYDKRNVKQYAWGARYCCVECFLNIKKPDKIITQLLNWGFKETNYFPTTPDNITNKKYYSIEFQYCSRGDLIDEMFYMIRQSRQNLPKDVPDEATLTYFNDNFYLSVKSNNWIIKDKDELIKKLHNHLD